MTLQNITHMLMIFSRVDWEMIPTKKSWKGKVILFYFSVECGDTVLKNIFQWSCKFV